MFYCKKLVFNVPLFQNMPIALINTIIFSLIQVLYMPGEVVVKYGKPGSSLYLIASGTVAIMNSEGKEVGHLKDGAFFGERALLKPGTPRSATIVALEITEIYKLNHLQLQACLQPCPRLKRRLVEENSQAERRPRVRRGAQPE
ncbi:uncharacterized protein LOC126379753 [Pectinophora gossypiella]|uniref:uncharacterized protein LOC126379753 n=1 Tax=Pectinophora gossypiella TaxID=13191 RepID=UPI00214EB013|nr:uncharacterized protein LOC126379753 [Pectinophora gossypiella]